MKQQINFYVHIVKHKAILKLKGLPFDIIKGIRQVFVALFSKYSFTNSRHILRHSIPKLEGWAANHLCILWSDASVLFFYFEQRSY